MPASTAPRAKHATRRRGRKSEGRRRRPWLRRLVWGLAFVAVAITWTELGPSSAGGKTSYLLVRGDSMEPSMHAGDFVVLRESATYRVGDVVAVPNPRLHVTVLHRIIDIQGDHIVTRGDNNDFTDSYKPTMDRVIGKRILVVAGAGKYIYTLKTPQVGPVFLGLLAMWAASGFLKPDDDRPAQDDVQVPTETPAAQPLAPAVDEPVVAELDPADEPSDVPSLSAALVLRPRCDLAVYQPNQTLQSVAAHVLAASRVADSSWHRLVPPTPAPLHHLAHPLPKIVILPRAPEPAGAVDVAALDRTPEAVR